MYEYYIENKTTGERDTMHGYDIENAYNRKKLNPAEWTVIFADYID